MVYHSERGGSRERTFSSDIAHAVSRPSAGSGQPWPHDRKKAPGLKREGLFPYSGQPARPCSGGGSGYVCSIALDRKPLSLLPGILPRSFLECFLP